MKEGKKQNKTKHLAFAFKKNLILKQKCPTDLGTDEIVQIRLFSVRM